MRDRTVDLARRDPRLRFATAQFAYTADPRLSWCMHLPPTLQNGAGAVRLLVAVHGSRRGCMAYRDAFAAFADRNGYVVLAPLFPVGVLGDGNPDGYKYLAEGSIRYDDALLGMIAELEQLLSLRFPTFDLFGFSGGGHFVHRFYYLHPERLNALVVGAPGGVTLLDDTQDFWLGTRDIAARFGRAIDMAALRRVRSALLVGQEDVEAFVYPPEFAAHVAGMKKLGRNRVERNATLHRNWRDHGLPTERLIVPGIAHEGLRAVPSVEAFLERGHRS
jgi:pimeloyl-ACP methyl ester carboxylesterase